MGDGMAGIYLSKETKARYQDLMLDWQYKKKKPTADEQDFLIYLLDLYHHDEVKK